jgi:HlyD family secretion protein
MTDALPAPATSTESLDAFLGVKPAPWWRRYAKWLVLGLIALGLILLALRLFGGSAAVEYAAQPVKRDTLQVTVSATGRLAPTNQVQVGSELSGLVVKVLVDVNDRVSAGQTIALIDPSRFADTVRQSEAALAANLAAVAQADATLAQARAQLARLEEVYRLSGGKVPSDTELSAGRAELARDKAAVAAAQANVVSARAALSSNRTNLTKTVIRSPVNGVVLARQIETGQTVAASFSTPTLFVIAQDLAQMKLPVAIDEADVGEVAVGQPATFTVDAFPGERFKADISRVELGSNQTVSSASSTSAAASAAQVVSYIANLVVSNGDLRLRPGMTATAEITTKARTNALQVPNAALRFTPDDPGAKSGSGSIASAIVPTRRRNSSDNQNTGLTRGRGASQTVYVLEAGKPRAVAIRTGVSNGTMTEVLSGDLKPGMQVITGKLAAKAS